jgi:hypothetical protein
MDRDRFFGGQPVAVLVRLVLLSIVVGIVLSALGISPSNLFYHLELLARRLYDMGFGALEWILGYFLIGALVVFPIWFIGRLLGAFGRRSDDRGS